MIFIKYLLYRGLFSTKKFKVEILPLFFFSFLRFIKKLLPYYEIQDFERINHNNNIFFFFYIESSLKASYLLPQLLCNLKLFTGHQNPFNSPLINIFIA